MDVVHTNVNDSRQLHTLQFWKSVRGRWLQASKFFEDVVNALGFNDGIVDRKQRVTSRTWRAGV